MYTAMWLLNSLLLFQHTFPLFVFSSVVILPLQPCPFSSRLWQTSIMAEVVGLVASGISIGTFAAQITGSIIKLKSYWDELQDIPEDVQDLIEELEYLYHLLADIEDDLQRNPVSSMLLDNTSTSRCLSHCKRGADRLKELTDDLSADIDSRNKLRKKWASTKVILKKDKLEKYKRKLERVVTLLSLAYQSYIRWICQSCGCFFMSFLGICPSHWFAMNASSSRNMVDIVQGPGTASTGHYHCKAIIYDPWNTGNA